jgi:hypothetical protein
MIHKSKLTFIAWAEVLRHSTKPRWLALGSDFEKVRPEGLESVLASSQNLATLTTDHIQTLSLYSLANMDNPNNRTPNGHPKDIFGASACSPGVPQSCRNTEYVTRILELFHACSPQTQSALKILIPTL